ncbi:MAG: RagB/SusD family nutrient uptake outer membrane protein, partial [Cyclobacteriaceae bacterium]
RKDVSFVDSAYLDQALTQWVGYDQFAPNHGSPRPHIAKYWANPGNHTGEGGGSDNNYSAMRYAEVLLTAAEAAINLGGQDAEAVGYINQVRARARNWNGTMTTFPADLTGAEDLTQEVREERRLELAFEYKRWYDIKRWGIGDAVFGPGSLEPHGNFDATRDYYFPLPQDELDRNENLKPQNTGY